ncbi:carboxymuconolactone decarboxylase family protein [Arthrobacter sp. zg-Y411]|uniref:carboxymuconolactone decarboxylase family protein n=1 Tax=Arthrobacter zhangbolii TaxID=2886936 RepID=UPI001D138366|nr:carboxymuconolactone decarboxylase family protein [Arthrobacter zhangbolii]MCC3294285.1 carboxymuconolactone decarboxylase family protein [Arthrobacter zhangbolii]
MTAEDPRSPQDTEARREQAEATFARLFGPRDRDVHEDDPELMEILRRFIFADVFGTGVLDDRTRELITVTVLACMQTLPQLTAHTAGALHVGVTPVQIREAVYRLAPFIGFPRTLNALSTINAVFRDRGIPLPLPAQGVEDDDAGRYCADSPSSCPCTALRSGTTWPICPSPSMRTCPGSSRSSVSGTSTPAAG